MEKKEEKKVFNKKLLWAVIIVFVILCVLVVVCFGNLIIKNSKENNNTNSSNESTKPSVFNPNNINSSINPNLDPSVITKKPIIYLYPTKTTDVEVKLGNPENLSCTYPKYQNGWSVTANPNGDLIDKNTGRKLYALYWEGENLTKTINLEEGFCVKGEDIAKFLEEKLEILGLNEREAEEFIIYWLPQMENNKYNYIRFETIEEQNKAMPLEITPKPDATIRVMMDWKALEEEIQVKEQILETSQREGFTAIEWGGTEIEN